MTEIERLKDVVKTEQACFHAAFELADYVTANEIAQRLELLTKQIILCQKQTIEEAAK